MAETLRVLRRHLETPFFQLPFDSLKAKSKTAKLLKHSELTQLPLTFRGCEICENQQKTFFKCHENREQEGAFQQQMFYQPNKTVSQPVN